MRYFINAWNVRDGSAQSFGPFSDLQFTYDVLRVQPVDGEFDDEFAVYSPDCQENAPFSEWSSSPDGWVFPGNFIASDFEIRGEV